MAVIEVNAKVSMIKAKREKVFDGDIR